MEETGDAEAPALDNVNEDEVANRGGEEDTADDSISQEVLIEHHTPDNKKTWMRRGILIGIAVIVVVVIVIAVSLNGKEEESPGKPVDEKIIRYDCHPDQESDDATMESSCKNRGCDWNGKAEPKCVYPEDYKNYKVVTISPIPDQDLVHIKLEKTDGASGFLKDIYTVSVDVRGIDDNVIRIKVYDGRVDKSDDRWEVPLPHLNLERKHHPVNPKYNVTAVGDELMITRVSTGTILFRTNLPKLIFSDQFLQITVDVPSDSLYGFGERQAPHEKSLTGLKPNERQVFTFLNHDGVEGKSSYGSHPFYLMYEAKNRDEAHGVLLLNSNAMDVTFTTKPALTYRTIGGVMDFLIFTGPTASQVMHQKAKVIGRTPMPPYWSLGFHLCRFGYHNTTEVWETFANNTRLGVPVDTQWVDIDYMDNFNVFTYDPVNFAHLPDFVKHLHDHNRHFVPMLDPALGTNESNPTPEYISGLEKDIFIKNNAGDLLVTRVWNPLSVIPDFTHPKAAEWWTESLSKFYEKIQFDGMWIDMNEPATTQYHGSIDGCTSNTLDNPQYNPYHPLSVWDGSICFSARQNISRHYDLHNLYSLYEAKLTYEALTKIRSEKRPFVLSRASTTGQGMYSNHWLGDVSSSWKHLRSSIPGMLDFNLFGIPMVGSDICGFNDDTTDELCSRWTSLGSFYTFARNHNSNNSSPQDPASMGTNVLEAAKKSLNTRYTFLPYLYTLFYHNTITGEPVLKSLKMNFPEDEVTNSNDKQFMWGDGLLVNPVMEKGKTSVEAYFPAGVWYNYPSGHILSEGAAQNVTLDVPVTEINIALRGGKVFPTIPSVNRTTHDHRRLPFTLLAALDQEERASGSLYWDDGEQLDAATDDTAHSLIHFNVKNSAFHVNVISDAYNFTNRVNEIHVWGVKKEVEEVVFKAGKKHEKVRHTYVNGRLRAILPLNTMLLNDFTIKWSY